MLQACVRSGETPATLLKDVALFPQTLINVRLKAGQAWQTPALSAAQREVEQALGDSGRVLIRPSGTEPLVRVMVEARDAKLAQQGAQRLADVVLAA